MSFTREQVLNNHAKLRARNAVYRSFGYDIRAGVAFVLKRIGRRPGRVLEIGTGKGRFTVALAARAGRVTTLDIDAGEQRCARLNAEKEGCVRRIRFLLRDARSLPWRRPAFDVVVSMNTLHHIPDAEQVVREAARVCKPGGRIVLADFNEAGYRIMDRIHEAEGRRHHREFHDWNALAGLLRGLGWRVSSAEGACQAVLIARGPGNVEPAVGFEPTTC